MLNGSQAGLAQVLQTRLRSEGLPVKSVLLIDGLSDFRPQTVVKLTSQTVVKLTSQTVVKLTFDGLPDMVSLLDLFPHEGSAWDSYRQFILKIKAAAFELGFDFGKSSIDKNQTPGNLNT